MKASKFCAPSLAGYIKPFLSFYTRSLKYNITSYCVFLIVRLLKDLATWIIPVFLTNIRLE
jgi:hypothetical protein